GSARAQQLVAYVVPNPLPADAPGLADDEGAEADLVSRWKLVYDEIYSRNDPVTEATFNIAGWNSSYTGLPIPSDELREQVDATVERILQFRPQRILEIGCGTGLLVF